MLVPHNNVMHLNNVMVESLVVHVVTIHLKAHDHKKDSLSSVHSDEFPNSHNFMVMVQDNWLGVGEQMRMFIQL
jgi:hypothetical protein